MNELINDITAGAFILMTLGALVAFYKWARVAWNSRKPTINDRYNQSRPMATYKDPVISDAEEFDKLINDQEFMNALGDEV